MSAHSPAPSMETDTMTNKANWRDQYQVNVGWVSGENGFLRCDVVETWQDSPMAIREPHPVKSVRWANGKVARVVWSQTFERYVFKP